MIDKDDLLSLIEEELSSADQGLDFEQPLDYYLGNPRGDETEGRSQVVSLDVADAIEWIMPQIMRSFVQNNEVLIFDPIGPQDEYQAELESQYVYEVLMKENDGFITLHQFVKDALLQNNGYIKVWYDSTEKSEIRKFTDLVPEQLQAVMMTPGAEIVWQKEQIVLDPQTGQQTRKIDAKIEITSSDGRIRIESVAPEDFRVNADHNSINMDDARFTAHLLVKTISELRKEGIPEETIQELMDSETEEDRSAYRFTSQGEHAVETDEDMVDESLREVYIAECYMHADVDDDGIAERVKVTVGGQTTPSVLIGIEEIECSPWIATTAVLMSHKWRGLSIYDRLKTIQDIKTTLLRNTLDNVYFQNNQRHLAVEGQVNMSDLMLSRPGGIVRVKAQNAVTPLVNPQIAGDTFTLLNYFDQTRAGRAGVSPEDSFKEHKIGSAVGSEGVEAMLSAKEELVGLIVRVIAETGIKPLSYKIRDLCTKHIDAIQDYQFRGQWVRVHPAAWPDRLRATVRVGTGSGHHARKVAALEKVVQVQAQILQMPGQTLVDAKTQYKAYDDYCKYVGLESALSYFIDPESPEGQQKAQQKAQGAQQKQQEAQMQAQAQLDFQAKLAQAEVQKAQVAQANVQLKAQVEQGKQALEALEQRTNTQIEALKLQLDKAQNQAKQSVDQQRIDLERDKVAIDAGIKITELELQHQTEASARNVENISDVRIAAG